MEYFRHSLPSFANAFKSLFKLEHHFHLLTIFRYIFYPLIYLNWFSIGRILSIRIMPKHNPIWYAGRSHLRCCNGLQKTRSLITSQLLLMIHNLRWCNEHYYRKRWYDSFDWEWNKRVIQINIFITSFGVTRSTLNERCEK